MTEDTLRWGTGYRRCGTCDAELEMSGLSYCSIACACIARDRRLLGQDIRNSEHESDK